jgi:signal transduction histidine kinase
LYLETVNLNLKLEEQNRALILELAERQLIEQKLQHKNEELNIFLYRSSHDLRSPLCSILGLVNLAHTEIKDSTALQYFGMIEKASQSLDAVLLDLSKVSRIRTIPSQIGPIDFHSILENIKGDLLQIEEFHRIKFEVHIHLSKKFYSNELVITTMLYNLFVHAIRYRNQRIDHSFVAIAIEEVETFIQIKVSDNGIGIDKENTYKVFDMFFKGALDSTCSGLGLYLVKCAVEKLEGKINLHSELLTGSVFTILLPTNAVPADFSTLLQAGN